MHESKKDLTSFIRSLKHLYAKESSFLCFFLVYLSFHYSFILIIDSFLQQLSVCAISFFASIGLHTSILFGIYVQCGQWRIQFEFKNEISFKFSTLLEHDAFLCTRCVPESFGRHGFCCVFYLNAWPFLFVATFLVFFHAVCRLQKSIFPLFIPLSSF